MVTIGNVNEITPVHPRKTYALVKSDFEAVDQKNGRRFFIFKTDRDASWAKYRSFEIAIYFKLVFNYQIEV